MATIIDRLRGFFSGNNLMGYNVFNELFYRFVGDGFTEYDPNGKTYVDEGYNKNSVVYSIIQQQSTKVASVPLFIQKTSDKNEVKNFGHTMRSVDGDLVYQKKKRLESLKTKAFEVVDGDPNYIKPPLNRPNPNNTWTEFLSLSETMLRLTGNVYWYMPKQESGREEGQPFAIYVLPSHLMRIVLKSNADLVVDSNPIKEFMLIEGYTYDSFPAEDVVHITFSNPNFGSNGEHLYGQSPLRAALKNIQILNEGMDLGIKTMQNAGAFGFIHGKSIPLQEEQAKALKSRLREMDRDAGRLGKIAGISTDIGFTRISLTTDELKPFDYFKYNTAEIANCLGWSVLLLNNVDGAKYDNLKQIRQRVITDTIMPDCELIAEALNNQVWKRFKGYERAYCYFDYSLLPEMQSDMSELVKWLSTALKDGVINRDEYREAISYAPLGTQEFQAYTVQFGVESLEDALADEPNVIID